MNQDQHNIFDGYKQILNEQMAPAAPPAVDAGQAIAQAEQLMANGPGQDAAMLQQQVQAVQAAQDAINSQVEQLNLQIDRDEANAAQGNPIDMSGENPGVSVAQSQLQQLNDKMTSIMQMAQTLAGPAQQAGVDTSMLTENLKRCIGLLKEHAGWYARNLVPGKDGASLNQRMQVKQMLLEGSIDPKIFGKFPGRKKPDAAKPIGDGMGDFSDAVQNRPHEVDPEEYKDPFKFRGRGRLDKDRINLEKDDEEDFSADPNYLRDVLGYEPEDFEHEDPDQAAMDRTERDEATGRFAPANQSGVQYAKDDTVELANHDRPSNGPEDGLMGDVEALERLLDDETRAVMDDEGGTMSRREARETAKDILKQLIDRL